MQGQAINETVDSSADRNPA